MVQPMPLRQRADSSEGWTAANRAGNKQQRKAKRANDAKKIQKRELSQDLWGRQRGGGKGHWKKKLPGRGGHYGNGIRNQIHDQIQAITALDGANADLAETTDPALETDGPPTPLSVPESPSQQRPACVASPQVGHTIRWGSAAAGVDDWATPRRTAAVSRLNYGGAAAAAAATAASPPPPPSPASSAVFGGTLPSLTPKTKTGHKRIGSAAAAPPLSRDSIVHAIFEALFGRRQVRRGPRESYGGAWDESDDDGDDPAADAPDAVVDESWIKSSMDVSLFSSKALQFAVSSVRGADLLSRYVDADAVSRLVDALRRDDPRVPSPRLAILRAVHEHCRHLRLPMLRAAAAAAQERLAAARAAAARARDLEVEAAPAAVGAGGKGAARDQGQTLLELLLYLLEHMPEPQEVGAGGGGGGALLAQFEQEAAAELRTAAQAAAGDGGAQCREPAKGYAAVAAAARAAREERDGEWPAGVRGDTLRESLRLLLCSVKCYGTVPTSGDAGGGSGGADEDELNLLQRAATALVTLHPPAAEPLISRLSAAWPAGDGHREAGCLAVAGAALSAATAALRPLPPQSRAARALMRRALASVTSPGTRVVQAAVALLLAPPALHGLLAPRRENLVAATAALAANRAHWSPLVRDLSEQSFDALLDFY